MSLGPDSTMADIDSRTVDRGRYFTALEGEHRTDVCMIGDTLVQQLFWGGPAWQDLARRQRRIHCDRRYGKAGSVPKTRITTS